MGGKHWTDQELEILKNEYGKTSTWVLAEKLGKTKFAIILKANRTLKLYHPPIIINNERICTACKTLQTIDQFHKSNNTCGYKNICKKCKSKEGKIYRSKPGIKQHESDQHKKRLKYLKDIVYQAYGGYICKCCGEKEIKFLSIDHIDGQGNKKRKELYGAGITFYRWLIKNNFPSRFQILCMNCQFGRKFNNGTCPHQEVAAKQQADVFVTNSSDNPVRPIWLYNTCRSLSIQ